MKNFIEYLYKNKFKNILLISFTLLFFLISIFVIINFNKNSINSRYCKAIITTDIAESLLKSRVLEVQELKKKYGIKEIKIVKDNNLNCSNDASIELVFKYTDDIDLIKVSTYNALHGYFLGIPIYIDDSLRNFGTKTGSFFKIY